MSARSSVFDLYGDHLGEFDHWAPVAGIVAVLGATGVKPSTTRTAVSRMTEQGWLAPDTRDGIRGYRATAPARTRLAEASRRIYRREQPTWDGRWHLTRLDLDGLGTRRDRDRLIAALSYLGLGRFDARTWIAPRPVAELGVVVEGAGVPFRQFEMRQVDTGSPRELVESVWDLSALADAYRAFTRRNAALLTGDVAEPSGATASAGAAPGAAAYRARAGLVHDWRKFLFLDPDLPDEVLPQPWPGAEARAAFLRAADAMWPRARIFVHETLTTQGGADGDQRG